MSTASQPRTLARGTEIIGLPVVAVDSGDALALVKDVLYDPEQGMLVGFTLNKKGGVFAGPLKRPLAIDAVLAVGRDAVMVGSADALSTAASETAERAIRGSRNVLGNDVLTDGGERLGRVIDLVVVTGRAHAAGSAAGPIMRLGSVVGYEFTADATLAGREGADLLVPLPHTLAVSGNHLVVPESVGPYIRDDLTGFSSAVTQFRAQQGTGSSS